MPTWCLWESFQQFVERSHRVAWIFSRIYFLDIFITKCFCLASIFVEFEDWTTKEFPRKECLPAYLILKNCNIEFSNLFQFTLWNKGSFQYFVFCHNVKYIGVSLTLWHSIHCPFFRNFVTHEKCSGLLWLWQFCCKLNCFQHSLALQIGNPSNKGNIADPYHNLVTKYP